MSRPASCAVLLCFFFQLTAAGAQTKFIKLRNQLIAPKSAKSLEQAEGASPRSGLFLIQVIGPLTEEQRAQLAGAGVEILRYIPDDGFLTRFNGARSEVVRALPFVQWTGEYRPEHKTHRSLWPKLNGDKPNESVNVAVLLAPRANAAAIAEAKRSFVAIRQESHLRAGTVLRGTINSARVTVLARSDTVLWIEPSRPMKLFDEVSSKIVAGDGGPQTLLTQSLGYDGAGVSVAVADSGLDNGDAISMHPDLLGRTPAFFYYGNLTDAADEHSHGTHVSGIIAGNAAVGEVDDNGALYGLGVAPGASIIAQRIFDGVGNFESPPSFEKMTRDATRSGAVIGSNSWGDDTQGTYDISAMEFDELVRDADTLALGDQQYILEFSAGNAGPGPQTVGSPAVAKNVIATGACENDRLDFFIYDSGPETMADFSSRGPCEDGRIKPDVVAPGTWIASLQSASAPDVNAWLPISAYYQYQGGTSQAGPHASGAAAVFVQYYRLSHTNSTPSPALVKAALINSAVDMFDDFGTDPIPNADEGWGRIDLTELVDSTRTFEFIDQQTPLSTGQIFERRVVVSSAEEAFRATLTYTDVPGFPGALAALVNNLDLEVVAPDGRIYRGNQFEAGESKPNTTTIDSINNVEGVYLNAPIPGEYIVRVRAQNVVEDARIDTGPIDQDFALVISAQRPSPGTSFVTLDRKRYTAPSQIRITVSDPDQAGQPSLSVQLRSTTEPAGENVLLLSAGPSGSFTGAVAAVTGAAAADGKLQVANNDTIEVHYFDASAGAETIATAQADLAAPVITAVSNTNQFGQTLIVWQTSEPANSWVRYGTNQSLVQFATNSALTTSHSVALPGLVVGTNYFFVVMSTDEAGNTATNNNGGASFSFVAPQIRTLLLVDDYVSNGFDNDIPLSVYTDALNAAGVTYDVWDTTQVTRAPGLVDLKPYRVVIWRFNDGVLSADTLTADDQNAIRSYLNAGGSFFMASMEQLTRLGNGFFRRDVLHVPDFNEDVGVPDADGIDGDPISAGMSFSLEYSQYDNFFHQILGVPDDISDTMNPAPEASPFLYDLFGETAGLKFPRTGEDSPGRVVYLSFPLDAVSTTNAAPNDRATLMRNILTFLVPGLNGRGTIAFNSTAFNIPSTAIIEVGDSDLAGHGSAAATVFSSTQTNGVPLVLTETAHAGLFRGSINLIASTNPPTAGKLRVSSGDQVWVDYFDASATNTVRATAVVDTQKPGLTNVLSFPDYEEATITWTTTEPADSLVQFGESAFLNRTASDPALSTSHEVTLRGLLPDKTYYYQVTSVDAAGNVMVDNNNSNLYTFHTLQALVAPWTDNMNSGATNWSVFNADDSQSEWTLGQPNNQLGTNNAHSPPAAWGSNLDGIPIDYTETFLISPALYLTNGNIATVRFWHNYDFSRLSDDDIIEMGQVLVITNTATEPVVVKQYEFEDATSGWEQDQVDLSPYVGHVVYVVWYYALGSFETLSRPGWLVDDVSVTVSNLVPGTIQITNNLWQTTYILSGQRYLKGKGLGTVITNAPPGRYIVEFADVPYYFTPVPQTNDLASGGTNFFVGNYTFADVNTNGISDAWETNFFNTVSPSRTRFTDSDSDGMTDYAEFIAGTDPLSNVSGPFSLSARLLTNSTCLLQWPSRAGQQFRVHASTNGVSWSAYSGWLESTGAVSSFTVPIQSSGPNLMFRVEAGLTSTSLPANLQLTAQRLSTGAVRLQWASSTGRGYRVLGSTNLLSWSPVSTWIRATSGNTTYTLPTVGPGQPNYFRLEVQP
jgi:hypothetical protein